MKYLHIILLSIIVSSFSSCKKIDATKGDQEEFNVIVGEFDGILLKGPGEVYYTNDTVTSITVMTTEKVFKALTFNVLTNTLQIGVLDGYTITNSESLKIYVSKPMVNRLYNSGSGDVFGDFDSIPYTTLAMDVSGSGNITATNIVCSTLNGTLSGSGAITLTGAATSSNQDISGSGNFHIFDLTTLYTNATASGSGNISLQADSTLDATISGSGSIYYRGFPTITLDSTGSGSLVDAN